MFGKSFDVGSTVLSPYIGLGYMFLLNNDKGSTFKATDPDTGEIIIDNGVQMSGTLSSSAATKRKQSYLYIPIGVIHKAALSEKTRLVTNLEYDLFLNGKNTTSDSDGDSHYTQKKVMVYGEVLCLKKTKYHLVHLFITGALIILIIYILQKMVTNTVHKNQKTILQNMACRFSTVFNL